MWVTPQSALTRGVRVKLRTAPVQRTQAGLDLSSFCNQKRDSFFFFFLLSAGSLLLHRAGFSLAVAGEGSSLGRWVRFSLRWLLLWQSPGSRAHGLQELRLPGSRAQAQ